MEKWKRFIAGCLLLCGFVGMFGPGGCGQKQESHRVSLDGGTRKLTEGYARSEKGLVGERKARGDLVVPGKKQYDEAIQAVWSNRYEDAKNLLEQTVAQNAEFTEAWYNLGATYGVLAVIAAHAGEDSRAISLFRQAVEAKKKAKALMDQGKFVFYNADQQATVKHDVEKALEDADEVLANEETLLMALRMSPVPSR